MQTEKTVEVIGYFGKPKQITRAQYIQLWVNHAGELIRFDINVCDEVSIKAGEEWDRMFQRQNKGG